MDRLVVVLCGPPGAGKTTAARDSGLDVYDRDDYPSEPAFLRAAGRLADDPEARAVVIRWAPTTTDRARITALVQATVCYLLIAPPATLRRRLVTRGRHDLRGTLAGVTSWFAAFDRDDGVPDFPGWPAAGLPPPEPASQDW